jgi:ABC-2 type transport system permease protein
MNATSASLGGDTRTPIAAPHATHKFRLLLRREFWEHKGGFFWAPFVAGAISLLLTLMAIIVGEVVARRAMADGKLNIDNDVTINGLDLGHLTSRMSPDDLQNLSNGVDLSLYASATWPFIVLGFVVFFYCLGALYDERKDRSVLFWKSLPLSDRDTVLSKAASALVVAPVIAVGAAIATMFAFLLMISVAVLFHGGNPITLLWGPGSPLAVVGNLIAMLPIYALWALPTVGWLMLCSAWARSKPFLWAVMIPVFAGIFVAWFDIMNVFNLDTTWFWQHVVARSLTSVFPGLWMSASNFDHLHGPDQIGELLSLRSTYTVLASPQLWIGVVAGIAMIIGAIRLRRWRDDNA